MRSMLGSADNRSMMQKFEYGQQTLVPVRYHGGFPCAVVLFLGGDLHFATHRSAAERELLARGAIHVGMLRFDAVPAEVALQSMAVLSGDPVSLRQLWGSTRN